MEWMAGCNGLVVLTINSTSQIITPFPLSSPLVDWKPFHHDAAAIKPWAAKKQNATVAASFGAEREVAFQHMRTGAVVSAPLPNGSMYAFGRDVNVEVRGGCGVWGYGDTVVCVWEGRERGGEGWGGVLGASMRVCMWR